MTVALNYMTLLPITKQISILLIRIVIGYRREIIDDIAPDPRQDLGSTVLQVGDPGHSSISNI